MVRVRDSVRVWCVYMCVCVCVFESVCTHFCYRNRLNVLETVCCGVLRGVAGCCRVLRGVAVCCSVLQCVAVRCSVWQCVAVCCSVLQCVAVCGSVRVSLGCA